MAFGVKLIPSRTTSKLLQNRIHTRAFCRTVARAADSGQHCYFQHDSPVVRFPEQSQYSNYIPTAEGQQHTGYGPARELPEGQKWVIFFSGFFSFPLVCLAYYWSDFAVGSKLWKSEVKELEEQGIAGGSRSIMKSSQDQFMETNNLYQILQRANAETKALHDLTLLWINPDVGLHAVRDTNLLTKYPIKMSDGKMLDLSKAALIRVLDKDSKTVVLLLGVDMSGHSGSEADPALAWCHDYALRGWMDDRAEELKKNGEAAEQGVSLYCYTATSSATSLPGKKGEMWQEARLFPEDLPSGFPLKALEGVKDEITAT